MLRLKCYGMYLPDVWPIFARQAATFLQYNNVKSLPCYQLVTHRPRKSKCKTYRLHCSTAIKRLRNVCSKL